jgi:hypothetical protein
MKRGVGTVVRFFTKLGLLLIMVLSFWAADWWSLKLLITIPIGIIAYYCILVFAAGGAKVVMDKKSTHT